jgi:hypothetical protein
MRQLARLALALLLSTSGAEADAPEGSLNEADGLWDRTLEYADSTLEQARRLWREAHTADARLWQELMPRLDEILALQDRQPQLPESAWLSEDQTSNAARIDALLDEAAGILVGNNALRSEVRELTRTMAENRRTITELNRRRIAAPSDSLWRETVQDIDEEIAERERILDRQRAELERVRRATAAELRALGLEIDDEGLEFLLSTVVGDDVVDMTLAFEQVRRLTEQLQALTTQGHEDLPTARRYYGMYTVMLEVLDHMNATLVDGIERDYLPRIAAIGDRARLLRRQTQALQAKNPSTVLQANLEAQQLTIDAAGRYAAYLRRQRQQLATSRQRLAHDLAVARNTYETVKMSGELVALMRDSQVLLDSLFRLQVPTLRAFENRAMKREFQRLTWSLREDRKV